MGESAAEMKAIQRKANFLVNRLADMLSWGQDVAILDIYWSNKFTKTLDSALTEKFGANVGYTPIDIRKLQLYSVQEIQDKIG